MVGTTEIFINPSWKELMEITNRGEEDIRFSALHSKKKVYVWRAYDEIHDVVAREIPYKKWNINYDLLEGIAYKQGSLFVAHTSDQLMELVRQNEEAFDDIINKDWTWLKRYKIDAKDLLDEYRGKNEI